MIETDEQLRETQSALSQLEANLVALNRQRAHIHPDRFALIAEPIFDHIRGLRAEIDAYVELPASSFR